MNPLSDQTVDRLRRLIDEPDFSGTKYRIVEEAARGGMGTVYVAEDRELGRQVAMKVLNVPDPTGAAAARMMREARIIAGLEHPGIVPVHDVGTLPDGRVFYTMKLVRGRRLDPREGNVLRLFEKACEAVAFANAHGVIHRDLKPENIMVGEYGEVLILDWGVAALAGAPNADEPPGTVIGTPSYMAPEQSRGDIDSLDARTDVYALGAILAFLLGDSPPRALAAVCRKAMADDRDARYPSAQALGAEVTRYLDGRPVEAYRESIPERLWRWISNNRVLVLLVLAYLAMRGLVLFFAGR